MSKLKINIILPSFCKVPSGGYKMMYEYANQLAQRGHDIVIYHAMSIPYQKPYRNPIYLYLKSLILKNRKPSWVKLHHAIKVKGIFKITNHTIRDANIVFFTQCNVAFPVSKLSSNKGTSFNLVQGYEDWVLGSDMLKKSYKIVSNNITVSDFIADKIEEATGKRPHIIYNAIDNEVFNIKTPIAERNPHTVSMLYSEFAPKGAIYGIEALKICKQGFQDLKATLFGVCPRPQDLPSWINYQRCPDTLNDIYNSTAIFLTPSLKEGWGLTATEAMNCGCALVSTTAEGLRVFAIDNVTALTTQPGDAKELSNKLRILLHDNRKRILLAQKGYEFVQQYSWENSINKLEALFNSK